LTPLTLIDSLYFNTCSGYCLQVITTSTKLTGTLLSLGDLDVVALELTSLVLNMFYTWIFLGHFPNLCSALKQITQGYWIDFLIPKHVVF
jgi:hypothetical protein